MSSTANQDYANLGQQVEQEVEKQPTKKELKINKTLEKKAAKSLASENYAIVRKASRWLSFKRWAISFFVLSVIFIIVFVLMKYLNYYFNFGPMDSDTALRIGTVNWLQPFNKWSWDITNDFANILVGFQYNEPTGIINVQQVVVEGVEWATAGGSDAMAIAVSREAFITNNFANGMLYLAAPISLVLGFLFLLFHFLFGRTRAKAIINKYISLTQAQAYKLGQLDCEGKNNSGVSSTNTTINNSTSTSPIPVIINLNGQPINAESTKQVMLDTTEVNQKVEPTPQVVQDSQKTMTTTTTQVTKTVKPTVKPEVIADPIKEQEIKKTTHIYKIQPDVSVEEHVWEKPEPLPKVKKNRKSYPSLGKNELINEVYNDLKGTLTIKQLGTIYDLTFESIVEELDKETAQDINIFNFGKFNSIVKPGHTGVNPATREKIWIEDKAQLKFAPSLKFKKLMEDADIKQTKKTVKTTVETKKG